MLKDNEEMDTMKETGNDTNISCRTQRAKEIERQGD